jgi:SAC3 family protein LENG8/THP3
VKLRFVTDELGFESDEESARFVCDNGGEEFLQEKEGIVRLVTGKSAALFETTRKAAFAKIDIKGQI